MADAQKSTSKSAKKNAKRRSKEKPDTGKPSHTFTIVEEIGYEAPPQATPIAAPIKRPSNPIADLKQQIEEAKAVKDHKRAQELRQQMWKLQDKAALGTFGPEPPEYSAILENFISPSEPPQVSLESMPSPVEKKLAKLRKKLQAVEALKEQRDRGEKLEANQLAKIDKEGELLEEIEIFKELQQQFQLR